MEEQDERKQHDMSVDKIIVSAGKIGYEHKFSVPVGSTIEDVLSYVDSELDDAVKSGESCVLRCSNDYIVMSTGLSDEVSSGDIISVAKIVYGNNIAVPKPTPKDLRFDSDAYTLRI